MKLSLQKALDQGTLILEQAKIEEAGLDARLLLQHTLKIDYAKLLLRKQEEINSEQFALYHELILQRATRKPLQYVLGEQDFMGYCLQVTEATLIPRRETEELIEQIVTQFKSSTQLRCLDIGTGSGCIPIATCKLLSGCTFVALDYAEDALKIAEVNVKTHQLESRIRLVHSDILQSLPLNEGKFDLIISNPPYIESDEINNLMQEVREFEPRMALDGGADGLYFYNAIARDAREYLNPKGMLMFEIGYNQRETVWKLLEFYGYQEIECKKDLSENDRIIFAKLITVE